MTQILVPVNPVCPKLPAGVFFIKLLLGSIIQPNPFLNVSCVKNC
jgi:hypothetical protein